MVDISAKVASHRMAIAQGSIHMHPDTLNIVREGTARKGDVLGVARIAGIQAAKKTSDLIPLCHPLALTKIAIAFELCDTAHDGTHSVTCTATVETIGPTGVEMEALTAVQIALLTIYDMCKAVDKQMSMQGIRVVHKAK